MKHIAFFLVFFLLCVVAVLAAGTPNNERHRIDELEARIVALQDFCERFGNPQNGFVWNNIEQTQVEFVRPGEDAFCYELYGDSPRWKLLATGPAPLSCNGYSQGTLWRMYALMGEDLQEAPANERSVLVRPASTTEADQEAAKNENGEAPKWEGR